MIDPTSRDDPRFKELVKVRTRVPAGMFLWGQTLGFRLLWAKGAKLGAGHGALLLRLVEGYGGRGWTAWSISQGPSPTSVCSDGPLPVTCWTQLCGDPFLKTWNEQLQ